VYKLLCVDDVVVDQSKNLEQGCTILTSSHLIITRTTSTLPNQIVKLDKTLKKIKGKKARLVFIITYYVSRCVDLIVHYFLKGF